MSTQPNWISPEKPIDLTEKQLLAAILDGTFSTGTSLPPERELAQSLGITRPTLRGALQRLSRDGWIQIQQGKSTIVKDYWKEGNLVMLNALSKQPEVLTPALIWNLLEVRAALAPQYTRLAFSRSAEQLIDFLNRYTDLPDTPDAYAQADQELHHQLTVLSGNPIFTLIYNGFRQISYQAGLDYFASVEARESSLEFYKGLLQDAHNHDPQSAARRTAAVMQDSLDFWQKFVRS
ncbi:MAG: GntR family transcriptional regulator [Anaerolineaceae bacterium]|nr:GntR family transcriptional regulator [Anaerolineaceae bacterium]